MTLKYGTDVKGLKVESLIAIFIASQVYQSHNYKLTVTACLDGAHQENSLHYSGYAIDLRTKNISDSDKPVVIAEIKASLNEQYDVIFEGFGTDNEHLHIEFDAK